MINIWIIFTFLIVHWLADFVAQTDEQAKSKSSDNKALTQHVLSYSMIWTIPAIFILGDLGPIFVAITAVCHWVTDYFTSRLNTKLYKKGDIHNFFVSVGFDQVLHYVQLLLTYLLLCGG